MTKMIFITPYKEICGGEESIYDHVSAGYQVAGTLFIHG